MKTGIVKLVDALEISLTEATYVIQEGKHLFLIKGYPDETDNEMFWGIKEGDGVYKHYPIDNIKQFEMLFNGQYIKIKPEDYSRIINEGLMGWRTPFTNVMGTDGELYANIKTFKEANAVTYKDKETFTRQEVVGLLDKLAGDLEFKYDKIESPSIAITKWCQEHGI